MNQLHYKGYIGSVCFSEEDSIFHGKIIGINASISFEGESVKGLTDDFRNAVDEYLEFCQESHTQPEKSNFFVEISSEAYNQAFLCSRQNGIPINAFIENMIKSSSNS
jgi:predicted HicB family RNase H-like nuclease